MVVRAAARWGLGLVVLVCASRPVSAQQQAPGAARLLPDITAVGDIVLDLSPRRSLAPESDRFGVREVELGLLAAVDPYFRGDIYVGLSDEEGAAIEQAYITATALPASIEVRLGRFLMPLGKQNTTHRHDLHTIEYPHVLQQFLGEEGLKGTGVWVSRVFAPLGFYQEILVTAVEQLAGEEEEDTPEVEEPASRSFGGLGYSARLRNYWDLSAASNLEISVSGATSRRPQPLADGSGINARQSLAGADVTFRWRPLQQGLYRSFILQAEVIRQFNQRITDPFYTGPVRDFTGGYVFARYQLTRRLYLGARGDWVQLGSEDPGASETRSLHAGSAYLQFFPSEFSKLLAGYERVDPVDGSARNRILVQATFALGPHRPHPF